MVQSTYWTQCNRGYKNKIKTYCKCHFEAEWDFLQILRNSIAVQLEFINLIPSANTEGMFLPNGQTNLFYCFLQIFFTQTKITMAVAMRNSEKMTEGFPISK